MTPDAFTPRQSVAGVWGCCSHVGDPALQSPFLTEPPRNHACSLETPSRSGTAECGDLDSLRNWASLYRPPICSAE